MEHPPRAFPFTQEELDERARRLEQEGGTELEFRQLQVDRLQFSRSHQVTELDAAKTTSEAAKAHLSYIKSQNALRRSRANANNLARRYGNSSRSIYGERPVHHPVSIEELYSNIPESERNRGWYDKYTRNICCCFKKFETGVHAVLLFDFLVSRGSYLKHNAAFFCV